MKLYVKVGTLPAEIVTRVDQWEDREPAVGETVSVRRPEQGRKPFQARCDRIVTLARGHKLFLLELM